MFPLILLVVFFSIGIEDFVKDSTPSSEFIDMHALINIGVADGFSAAPAVITITAAAEYITATAVIAVTAIISSSLEA
jgi:hypothetical protein